jgi:opacity protein-like surface antigen
MKSPIFTSLALTGAAIVGPWGLSGTALAQQPGAYYPAPSYYVPAPAPAPAPAPKASSSQPSGFSLGFHGGLLLLQDVEEFGANITFDGGSGFVVPLGFHFGNGFSLELSAGYYTADVSSMSGKKFDLSNDSSLSLIPVMASGIIRLPANDTLSFYIGGGAGVVYHEVNVNSVNDFNFNQSFSELNTGLQAKLGVQFNVSSKITFDVGYRFQNVFTDEESLKGHSLEGGFTVRF